MIFANGIEAGYRNYGTDPWFFIRELAQNSRDAGAQTIRVRIGYSDDKEEVLTFEDDGNGMSYDEARRFLFRLYASSKDEDKNSAGMFGIGFWTVLKFNPSRLIIESRQGKSIRVKPSKKKPDISTADTKRERIGIVNRKTGVWWSKRTGLTGSW